MDKVKKYWLPITIGVIGVIYIIRSMRKTPSVLDPNGNVDTGSGSTTTPPATEKFPLKKGSKGELVKQLQLALGVDKLPRFGADGDFGTETLNALKAATGKTQVDSQAEIDAIAKKKDDAYRLKFGTEKPASESTRLRKPLILK